MYSSVPPLAVSPSRLRSRRRAADGAAPSGMQAEADVARDRAAQTSFPMRSNNPVEAERAEYGAPNSSTVTLSMSDGEMGGRGGGDALVGEGGGLGGADGGGCMETIRMRLLAPSVTTRDRLSGPKQSICMQETP